MPQGNNRGSNSQGRGWHGDSEGHSRAAKKNNRSRNSNR